MSIKIQNFRKIKPAVIVVIFLLPLLFTYIRDSYDWEGDTALLLEQAENIATGKPFYQSNFIYNSDFPILSPQYYPPLTPLLFSSIYIFFGHNIAAYLILESILFFLSGILFFLIFKRYLNEIISLIITILLVYNQFIFNTKLELMSDVPFLFFLMFFFLIYDEDLYKLKKIKILILALIAVIALQTRSLGYAIPITVSLLFFYEIIKIKTLKNLEKGKLNAVILSFLIFISSTIIFWIFFKLIFPSPLNGLSLYTNQFKSTSLQTILNNCSLYTNIFLDVIASPLANWVILKIIVRYSFLFITVVGLIKLFSKSKFQLPLIFTFVYIAVIIVYPYHSAGVRGLMPVIPFLIIMFIVGFEEVINLIRLRFLKYSAIGIFLFSEILIAGKGQYYVYKRVQQFPPELKSKEIAEAFSVIKGKVSKDKIIECSFPRAISFYTGRKSYTSINQASDSVYFNDWKRFNTSYIFISEKYSLSSDKLFTAKMANKKIKLLWQNRTYKLYNIQK